MRKQGRIARWEDERGFGFIAPQRGADSVFVHIKAFSGTSRRPEVGELVTYELAPGKDGRTQAANVRYCDEADQAEPTPRLRRRVGWAGTLVAMFASFLVVAAGLGRISWWVIGGYVVMSLAAFVTYGWDKSAAQRGKWRTAESTLLVMGLVGGWPGALAAQRYWRHKTSKRKFLIEFWGTVVLNVAAVAYLAWRGDAGFVASLVERLWQSAS
ncbi:MAG: DUF1294 domain-containing protein [Blastopirellula sp. JB062]